MINPKSTTKHMVSMIVSFWSWSPADDVVVVVPLTIEVSSFESGYERCSVMIVMMERKTGQDSHYSNRCHGSAKTTQDDGTLLERL
jgi:hypothetical protein